MTDFAIPLIAEEGLTALTVRGLARRIRVTPAGLQHWTGTREEMLVAITATFGQRWEQWIWRRLSRDGAVALLPVTPDEIVWTRVWLALQELGRTEPAVAAVVSAIRGREGLAIGGSHTGLTEEQRTVTLALVDGLRTGVCQGDGVLDAATARSILRRHLGVDPVIG